MHTADTVIWDGQNPPAQTAAASADQTRKRRRGLLQKLLQGRNPKELAAEDKKFFYKDRDFIDGVRDQMADWLECFELTGLDWRTARRFVRNLHDPGVVAKQQLARDSVYLKCRDAEREGERSPYLIPRDSTAFWGFGATTFWVMKELIRSGHRPQHPVVTSSFELAMLLYANEPEVLPGKQTLPELSLFDYGIDRMTGGVSPDPVSNRHIHVAVLSFDVLDKKGQFWSKDKNGCDLTNKYLAGIASRIVIVGDSSKMRDVVPGAVNYTLEIPIADGGPDVFLVTDERPPPSFNLDPRIQLVVVNELKADYARLNPAANNAAATLPPAEAEETTLGETPTPETTPGEGESEQSGDRSHSKLPPEAQRLLNEVEGELPSVKPSAEGATPTAQPTNALDAAPEQPSTSDAARGTPDDPASGPHNHD